jgi:sarcosine oxidase subunit beta
VAIVGGGLFGGAIAYQFALRGAPSVRLIDWDQRGVRATDRSAGILSSQGWDAWDLSLVRATAAEYRNLSERHGRAEFQVNGGLRVARTAEGERWLRRLHGELTRGGVEAKLLGSGDMDSVLPLGDFADVRSALFTPDDATFSPSELAQLYLDLAARRGVEVDRAEAAARIRRSGDGWTVETERRAFTARHLVLACGAWTNRVLSLLGRALPIAPFRSQAVELRPTPLASPFPTLHDLDLDLFVRPTARGRALLGDGTERREVDPDRSSEPGDSAFLEKMRATVRTVFPEWTSVAPERAWSGVCVASPDRFPLVGRLPGAPELYVAAAFNGLGAMRAAAFARLLVDGILDGDWGPLAPADPQRFPGPVPSFEPRPEFPLESESLRELSALTLGEGEVLDSGLRFRRLTSAAEAEGLPPLAVSEWFDPFLPHFLREAIRLGGDAEVAESDGRVVGVYLFTREEGVASIFTRARPVAERYLDRAPRPATYSESPWEGRGDPIEILAADLRDWDRRPSFRHGVRLLPAAERARAQDLMRAQGGTEDEAWWAGLPPGELCFVCEIDGRVAGLSWATLVGAHARGHSLLVHPRYRGLGIARDLLYGRMLALQRLGAVDVISEIYEGNAPARRAAMAAGMAPVGRMYHLPAR